jgi:hypothetical protein
MILLAIAGYVGIAVAFYVVAFTMAPHAKEVLVGAAASETEVIRLFAEEADLRKAA